MTENDERQFLHDLASPIGTALFAIDAVLETMENRQDMNPIELAQLHQVNEALARVRALLTERRNILLLRGVPCAGS